MQSAIQWWEEGREWKQQKPRQRGKRSSFRDSLASAGLLWKWAAQPAQGGNSWISNIIILSYQEMVTLFQFSFQPNSLNWARFFRNPWCRRDPGKPGNSWNHEIRICRRVHYWSRKKRWCDEVNIANTKRRCAMGIYRGLYSSLYQYIHIDKILQF